LTATEVSAAEERKDAPPTAPADEPKSAAEGSAQQRPQPQSAADAEAAQGEPSRAQSAPSGGAPPRAPSRSVGWAPLIGGGLLGGPVGRGPAGTAALRGAPNRGPVGARLPGLGQRVRDIAARPSPAGVDPRALDELASRVAKLEAAPPRTAAIDPAFANRVSAIEGQVKALSETVGILGRRSDEAVATARAARERAEATAAALTELTQKLAPSGQPAAARSGLEALAARVAARR